MLKRSRQSSQREDHTVHRLAAGKRLVCSRSIVICCTATCQGMQALKVLKNVPNQIHDTYCRDMDMTARRRP
jgi:hypothetical protein